MRIACATTPPGFLRNFGSTLALLAERGHTVHLVTDRGSQGGVVDGMPIVERLQARFPASFTLETIRASKNDRCPSVSSGVREGLNYLRYLSPAFADAPMLRERGRRQAPAPLVWLSDLPVVRSRAGIDALRGVLRRVERSLPYRREIGAAFDRIKPHEIGRAHV